MFEQIKKTLLIAFPIILGNFSQMLLAVIDIIMVGAIDHKQVAAASLVNSLLTLPFVFGFGLTRSISVMVAISNGKNDNRAVAKYALNGVFICLIFATVAALLIHFLHGIIFHMGQDKAVVDIAIPYLQLIGWSVIPMLLFMSLKEFTDALQYTKVAMVISLISLPLNVFLNWLLIYGKWGFPALHLEGAGWATLTVRILMAVALLIVIFSQKKFTVYLQSLKEIWIPQRNIIKEMLKTGVPSGMQYCLEAGAYAFSGIMIGWLGAEQQAAHQIALSCASLTFMISIGISVAGSIRVSYFYGQNDWQMIQKIGRSTLYAGLIAGSIFALLFLGLYRQIPALFNQEVNIIAIASVLLVWTAFFQISDTTQAIGVGLLRGIKDVKIPTLYVALAYWVVGLPAGYILGIHLKMNAAGIWIGFLAGLTISSALLNFRFLSITKTNNTYLN